MQSKTGSTYESPSDSEDELDWEEVLVPQAQQYLELDDQAGPSTRPNIEVTLEAHPTQGKGGTRKKPPGGISHAERLLRIECHKAHTIALIANVAVRNRWINDELLQARLLSLTPLAIQNSFAMIHKSRIPDDVKRGYLFEQAVSRLASWWADTFFVVKPSGHIRSRTFEDVQRVLHSNGLVDVAGKGKGKALPDDVDLLEDLFEDDGVEIVRSAKSLMKHALMRSGSRDISSQLFTALCRALAIPTRLVVSLQSVPWQTKADRSKTPAKRKGSRSNSKGKAPELLDAEDSSGDAHQPGDLSGDDMQVDGDTADKTSSAKSNGIREVSYTVKLRKSKSSGQRLGSPHPPKSSDPLTTPPVFWTEVFSRPDCRWLPVDPIRAVVNKRKVFDPTPVGTSPRPSIVDNRMMYVLAAEEDGYMRDVTPRYAKQYSAKVAKVQSGGKSRREWWAQIVQTLSRPYKLHRDDVEDDELVVNQFTEGMPTTISGFKDHPFYVLERHLLRDQIISQDAHELGKFRGESVYSRSQVLQLKAAENWMRHGRAVRTGEQPLKYVKQRAATLSRRRELEIRADAEGTNGGGSGGVMQGLYAERQTEMYIPPPVIDGKIPKNNFGNIDLYTPSMLPFGAAYVPHKGAAKIARLLGFDHAEAVTSFEFRKGKAFPVISGIVVAAENEDTILEAYWEAEHAAAQKEQEKRQQAVLKRWTKLVQGLRIRQRIREQYGAPHGSGASAREEGPPAVVHGDEEGGDGSGARLATVGGFLTGVEDVVQPYSLPRPMHIVFSSPPRSPNSNGRVSPAPPSTALGGPASPSTFFTTTTTTSDDDDEDEGKEPSFTTAEDLDLEADTPNHQHQRGMPKSMAALAAAAAAAAEEAARIQAASVPQMNEEGGEEPSATSKSKSRGLRPRPAQAQEGSHRRRKRARTRGDEVDDETSSSGLGSGLEREETDSDDNMNERPRVAKRARKQKRRQRADASVVSVPVPVPPRSDRVLRARKGKSPEQLARERERELAVRDALAG